MFNGGANYQSDHSTGFYAHYTTACGESLTATSHVQYIKIPSDFNHNQDCNWLIQARNPTEKIYLQINHISFPENKNGFSYLNIYDGTNADHSSLLGSLTSTEIPELFTSSGNSMYVQFSAGPNDNFGASYSSESSGKH